MKNFELNIEKTDEALKGLTIREVMERINGGQVSAEVAKPISDTQVRAAKLGLKVA